ncbi:molybdenum cofactor synthesis domain-containing protein [Thermogladius sp. KZ2Tp1]|uniref:MogA/MoaB family molybdenum cofactor biosynthesis protein n=1 Tax=Thermogladius sp. KZ2Tp1 TaxID=3136289 RepID=UPI003DAA33FA
MKALVLVVSDTVYEGKGEDVSGELAARMLRERGFEVVKSVSPNKPAEIIKSLREHDARLVVVVGGTGPSPRDVSVDVVESIAWREFPGFGEEFRRRSINRVGLRALLSRAGLYETFDGRIVAVLPGSTDGVEVGLSILLEIAPHLLEESSRIAGAHRVE